MTFVLTQMTVVFSSTKNTGLCMFLKGLSVRLHLRNEDKTMLRKRLTTLVISFAVAIGSVVGMSPTASATDYGINMNQACAYFTMVGWAWAKPLNTSDVYSWKCSTLPSPFWLQWGGNLDLELWCAYTHSGSHASFYNRNNAYSWYCRV